MADAMLLAAGVVLGLMLATWLASLVIEDASIVDMVWGFGFVLVAWAAHLTADPAGPRPLLVTVLVTIWGLRLTAYLVWRNWGKPEDKRYQAMRQRNPRGFWWTSLVKVYLLQGALMVVISSPVVAAQTSTSPLGVIDYAGLVLWLVGVTFESVGDYQLARFKARPGSRDEVMDQGLWRYTRHPNYFGDFCVWWGIYLIAAGGGDWWTVYAPLLMSFLLLRFSGVALLEKTITSRRPGYAEYVERTNAFFPGPRR